MITTTNSKGRTARLDIFAIDSSDTALNVEIQRSDRGAVPKRARYNSSLIDANITEPGDKYEKLPESFVIFITENDILGAELPLYHINRFVEETGTYFGDDAHIIYVNSQIQDETALGRLMHDFSCTNPSDMNYKILADLVRYFKSEKEGVLIMCRMLEEMRNETALKTTKEFALRLRPSQRPRGEPAMPQTPSHKTNPLRLRPSQRPRGEALEPLPNKAP